MKTANEKYVKTKDPFTQMELVILPTGKRDGDYAEFRVLTPGAGKEKVWLTREQIY